MSQPLNPYESPREADEDAGPLDDTLQNGEALQALVQEARRMEPWLLALAILVGFPAGAIITGCVAAFGAAGCLALLPTGALVLLMIAAVRMRYASKALGRQATGVRVMELVDAALLLFIAVSAVLFLVVVFAAISLGLPLVQ